MRHIHQFSVHPEIPARLARLEDLAYNLRWTWDHRAFKLFQHLDPEMLEKSGHNPVLMLRRVSGERLERAVRDSAFLAHFDRTVEDLDAYMTEPGWFRRKYPERTDLRFAYFCMEYGLDACLPIYSGGLGVLAGDHLKSASELDLPLVAVGLLYKKGYFLQRLNVEGWQYEDYRLHDFSALPVTAVTGSDGSPLKVSVDIAGRAVWAAVWLAQVGRIHLYLLDTSLPDNDIAGQRITSELYGGGPEERLAQEMVLGIGGMKALHALGIEPQLLHLNEGHTVFATLERIRGLREAAGLGFREARQVTGAGTLFTTHTPVPAGFDLFDKDLLSKYFSTYLEQLGLDIEEFVRMGKADPDDAHEQFNVAALALRQSPRRNSVSRLHRRVTGRMMQSAWPEFPRTDLPIESITNGVHTRTWVAPEMAFLFDNYLGPRWREDCAEPESWQGVERIPDVELWHTHARLRERLVAYVREQVQLQARQRRMGVPSGLARSQPLRPDTLTIGFARRFATYKRATLLFRDLPRFRSLLLDEKRPVQVIFAGKAHPRDGAGKELIREIVDVAQREGLADHVVMLEDYDLRKASMLVQGVDVWLNNPRRPYEACGTSGMKVLPNGGLNVSVLDGWWAEAYRPGVGWAIGDGEEFVHADYQDEVDSEALYSLLEHEVIPLFYDRDADGLPRGWITMMKNSIRTLAAAFSSDRMVKAYVERFYVPAADHYDRLAADDFAKARELAAWKAKVRSAWPQIAVVSVESAGGTDMAVGEVLQLTARIRLGSLDPSEVAVEAYYGPLRADGALSSGRGVPLMWTGCDGDQHIFRGAVPGRASGLHGYAVRVLPHHDDVLIPNELPLIAWE